MDEPTPKANPSFITWPNDGFPADPADPTGPGTGKGPVATGADFENPFFFSKMVGEVA
jgi:hypothetical protein